MEKKILEIRTEEKDGEFVIRLSGERAADIAKCFREAGVACCCRRPGAGEKEAAASCC